MIEIEGYLNKIIFHNKENNYYIMSVFLNQDYDFIDGDYLSVVGQFDSVDFKEEELYLFRGNFVEHKKYGKQLAAITAEVIIKKDKDAIISYLSSSSFKGIGKKTAELIVDKLGIDCLDKIFEDKESLFTLNGIPKAKKEVIYQTIIANRQTQDILLKLNEYNLSNQLILKIYNTYKYRTLEIIKNNPYSIINDIKGVSFSTIDKIAEKIGIEADDQNRIAAAFNYTINYFCYSSGNTFMKKQQLLFQTYNVLMKSRSKKLEKETILDTLDFCLDTGQLVEIKDDIALPEIYYSEYSIFKDIKERLQNTDQKPIDEVLFNKYIKEVEEELNIDYDISQVAAIKNSINTNFSILTGGPGTGKTTIILGIIKMFQKLNNFSYNDLIDEEKDILTLCAPTGKAAKRMSESTGFYASTIHKAIGWTSEDENIQEFVTEKKIKSKLVIIDEASMIDVFLMNNLLKIINKEAKIVIVGDNDQLPSIAPGDVLNDLIKSNFISTVKLNKIFRQAENSSIINLSHAIKNNINIDILENFVDREFLISKKTEVINNVLIIYKKLIENIPKEKIQILAPIYKTDYGIDAINKKIQETFNNNDIIIEYGELVYKIDDRVMQLVNRPEDNIFNGDIGVIYDIFKENDKYKIVVDFDDNFVTYEKQELNQLTLSYACSIHKSQGSEFDYVIIPLVDSYNFMLNKNLVYTAITRTKTKLFLCGNYDVFYNAINENNIIIRESLLRDFFVVESSLTKNFESNSSIIDNFDGKEEYILTPQNINFIDPLIGMDEITPFDFIE